MAQALQAAPRVAQEADVGSFWHRLVHGVRHSDARPDWHEFAGPGWEETILEVPVTDNHHAKQGRSTGRWILERDGRRLSVYLKRHYRLPWWQGVLAILWPRGAWSPGMRERRNLAEAAASGLLVPRVAAAGEWIGPGCRLRSFLAVEELVDMLPLHQAIPLAKRRLAAKAFRRWKDGLAVELARLARLLHDRRRFHKDLYLCHFYVSEADTERLPATWRDRVHVIDLHRLACHPWTWPVWLLKDLGGFLYSSDVEGVTLRDRVCFWRAYCGSRGRSWGERFWAWCIGLKGANYRRHNRKRARSAATP